MACCIPCQCTASVRPGADTTTGAPPTLTWLLLLPGPICIACLNESQVAVPQRLDCVCNVGVCRGQCVGGQVCAYATSTSAAWWRAVAAAVCGPPPGLRCGRCLLLPNTHTSSHAHSPPSSIQQGQAASPGPTCHHHSVALLQRPQHDGGLEPADCIEAWSSLGLSLSCRQMQAVHRLTVKGHRSGWARHTRHRHACNDGQGMAQQRSAAPTVEEEGLCQHAGHVSAGQVEVSADLQVLRRPCQKHVIPHPAMLHQ